MNPITANAFAKFDLTGRTAVVTGGGSGLGYFMSRGLARSGAKVLICSRREDLLADAARRLSDESDGSEVLYRTVDLAIRASLATFTDEALATLGNVDIFIGNAGLDSYEPIDALADDSIDTMFQVNVAANLALLRAFIPGMRANRWGRAVFSSSAMSLMGSPHEGASVYSAVKGALNAFTRTAATEGGHDNITVNAIVLGMFLTDMVAALASSADPENQGREFLKQFGAITALGRLGECEEIEGLIQFLCSDAGSYVTGTSLAIDGGMTIMLRPNMPADAAVPAQ